jgi:Asp/Glu/hydantoin racemase
LNDPRDVEKRSSEKNPKIFLIHATPLAMPAIKTSFDTLWPEAKISNLLDDSLSGDLQEQGSITPSIVERFKSLAEYAYHSGGRGIVFTCSSFGSAIDACKRIVPIPVLKPNEAMIEEALQYGDKIALMATFEPAIKSISDEFDEFAQALGRKVEILPIVIPKALEALRKGDIAGHDEFVAEEAKGAKSCDVICFAQFSMTSAAKRCAEASGRPVLTTPDSAVAKLKGLVQKI